MTIALPDGQRRTPRGRLALVLSACLLGGLAASAARALTLEEAVAAALAHNPRLRPARAAADAARGAAVAARAYPNPVLDLEAIPLTLGRGSELNLGIEQPLPISGRRGAAAAVAIAQGPELEQDARQAALEVAGQTRWLYRRALVATARSATLRAQWQAEAEVAAVARARFPKGEVSELDLGLLAARTTERRLQFESVRDDAGSALFALALWMGRPDTTGLSLEPVPAAPVPAVSELDSTLTQRPDLAALDAAVHVAEAQARLTRAERYPDPTVGVVYRRAEDAEATRNFIGGRVTWPLPLLDHRQAAQDLARARVRAAEVAREAGLAAARLELKGALARAEQARLGLIGLSSSAIDSTRHVQGIARAAYAAGRADAAQLAALSQSTLALELLSIDRLERWYDAIGAVEALVGQTLAPSVAR